MQANVLVVGSLNMDLVTRAPRLPAGGETLAGHSFTTVAGGKGANQAVAAARLGASVAMIGCVGADPYGEQLRAGLVAEGIDTTGVTVMAGASTGIASILVDDKSQNAIVIIAGANGELSTRLIDDFDRLLAQSRVVICQLEVPLATVGHVLKRARELGKVVILNPAPASQPLPVEWYPLIDYLVPNESEAQVLSGLAVADVASADAAATALLKAGAAKVMVTLGAQGLLFASGAQSAHFPAPVVQPLDTTAAGDTFVGGFAAALAAGKSEAEAIGFGQRAAAISVTRAGAQPSIPTLHEVQGLVP